MVFPLTETDDPYLERLNASQATIAARLGHPVTPVPNEACDCCLRRSEKLAVAEAQGPTNISAPEKRACIGLRLGVYKISNQHL